jgi:hypothetical protein
MLKVRRMRASKSFTLFVLCVATFTDNLMYGLILPVLPFALIEHIGLPEHEVQKWTSILMGTFGGAVALGSGKILCVLHVCDTMFDMTFLNS